MSTEKMIEHLFQNPGEWIKFNGRKGRVTGTHWFMASHIEGSRGVYHKVAELGQSERMMQDTMIAAYSGVTWKRI